MSHDVRELADLHVYFKKETGGVGVFSPPPEGRFLKFRTVP
jgi:hypothetical protein